MTFFVPNPDEVTSALYQRLAGGAALQTALGGSGRIIAQREAAPGEPATRLHVFSLIFDFDKDTLVFRAVFYLQAVAPNLGGGTISHAGTVIDRETLGLIIYEASSLLIKPNDGPVPFTRSGYIFDDCFLDQSPGPMQDPEDPRQGFHTQPIVVRGKALA